MGKAQKRARKKDFRDQRQAEWAAQERRRRIAMFGVLAVAVLGLIGFALGSGFVGGDEDEGDDQPAAAQPSPSDSPSAAPGFVATGPPACGGEEPPAADPQQYSAPPKNQIEVGVDYRAVVHTSCGDIEMDLLEEKAPRSVSNFIFLATEGFYDGLIWHRVEPDVIQTGDPNGLNGQDPDGPGYAIADEFPEKASEYVYGVVGMANAGPGSTGSQWFIVTHKPGPAGYQPLYSIFGKVDKGSYETLEKIRKLPTQGGADPATAVMTLEPVYIESIEIVEG
jgi:cyclophilin family peptidyl-prolyl cis-trans isomerase